jgi:hypothetical protein
VCAARSIWRPLCGDAGRSRKRKTVDGLMSGAIAPRRAAACRATLVRNSSLFCQLANWALQMGAAVAVDASRVPHFHVGEDSASYCLSQPGIPSPNRTEAGP